MCIRSAVLLTVLLLAACAGGSPVVAGVPGAGQGAAPAAASAPGWVRSELYFGLGSEEGGPGGARAARIDEASWRGFLDREVTPRFPDGLTVFDAYGQWRFRDGDAPERLRTRVLVILHEDSAPRLDDIEAIRRAWLQATGHESVLWSRHRVEVSF
ncbi:DUF3574 domain-containing protein [Pseudoxanthomonas suwonensis]|uniref:DUF3574 domain-containing protein n=1 Tax=Pseudoxanthomonas suwonensis TaxID=314722 RepID=UPI000466BAFF|nr:DUF3574 domain-containing protein [Pseudoxanthomonas suwonensis]